MFRLYRNVYLGITVKDMVALVRGFLRLPYFLKQACAQSGNYLLTIFLSAILYFLFLLAQEPFSGLGLPHSLGF